MLHEPSTLGRGAYSLIPAAGRPAQVAANSHTGTTLVTPDLEPALRDATPNRVVARSGACAAPELSEQIADYVRDRKACWRAPLAYEWFLCSPAGTRAPAPAEDARTKRAHAYRQFGRVSDGSVLSDG